MLPEGMLPWPGLAHCFTALSAVGRPHVQRYLYHLTSLPRSLRDAARVVPWTGHVLHKHCAFAALSACLCTWRLGSPQL